MAISREDVEHVAKLARLDLHEGEIETLTRELGRILEYVGKLSELDVTGDEPMMHAAEGAVFREDVPLEERDRSRARAEALRGAPSAADGFFRVPPVIDPGH